MNNKLGWSIWFVILIACLISLFFTKPLEAFLTDMADRANVVTSLNDAKSNSALTVHFVDVGQGDCIMIDLPDGKNMIIDGGDAGTDIKNKILSYAKQNIIQEGEKFDYMILTHPDADHINHLTTVIDEFGVDTVYRPSMFYKSNGSDANEITMTNEEKARAQDRGYNTSDTNNSLYYKSKDTKTYLKFLERIYHPTIGQSTVSNVVFAQEGLVINSSVGYTFTFYAPIARPVYSESNSFSSIMILDYQGTKFAFTGDATTDTENKITLTELPDVDGMQAGHHGSDTSSGESFVNALNPEVVLISCGEKSEYGHPSDSIITTYKDSSVASNLIFTTYNNGDLVFAMGYTNAESEIESNYVIAVSKGESFVLSIKWWYIAGSIVIISWILIFAPSYYKKFKKK